MLVYCQSLRRRLGSRLAIGVQTSEQQRATQPSDPHSENGGRKGNREDHREGGQKGGTATLTKQRMATRPPRLYAVIFHNDDFTTMEFVVWALVHLFERSIEEATQLMLQVHQQGSALVATYPREVAETKCAETLQYAQEQGMPLLVTIEPTDGDS